MHAGCHHLQQNLLQHALLGGLQVHCKNIIPLTSLYLPSKISGTLCRQAALPCSLHCDFYMCRSRAFLFVLSLNAVSRLHTILRLLQAFACCRSIATCTAQSSIMQKHRADALRSRLTKHCSCAADQWFTHLTAKCPMLVVASFGHFGFGS